MRLLRLILEGLLVTAVAALVFYPLRHHPVAGLVGVVVVCLVGIGIITWVEHRRDLRKAEGELRGEGTKTKHSKIVKWEDGTQDVTFTPEASSVVSLTGTAVGTWTEPDPTPLPEDDQT